MSMKYLGSLSIFSGIHPSLDNGLSTINYLLSFGNPKVKGWLLMDVGHVLIVAFAYLAIVFLLKYLMRNVEKKDAFQLRTFATLHNINLTLLSLYMCVETIRQALMNNYSLWGNAVDDSVNGDGMANICHIFFLSKILEFIDTFIMALKKNERQITFLHLYHHGSIFVVWWGIVYYTPGGDSYFTCALNSFIHVIMYSYYLWATFARKLKEGERPTPAHPGYYRKYITSMQMTQFMIMMVQAIYVIYVPSGYPRMGGYVLFFYMITMLALFGNFFLASYVKGGKKKDAEKLQKKAQ